MLEVATPARHLGREFTTALACVGLVALFGCVESDAAWGRVLVRDSAGVTIVEHGPDAAAPRCTVEAKPDFTISGESTEQQQLYRVFGAARLSDGRIALVNSGSHQLRFYDGSGQFLQQVGRGGQGPGEFSEAFYVWVLPGDTLWVGDYPPFRLHVFGPTGAWVRTVVLRPETYLPRELNVLQDGRALVAHDHLMSWQQSPAFQERSLTVVVHDAAGVLQDTIGSYPYGRWGSPPEQKNFFTYSLFESFTRLHALGTRLLIGHGSKPELFVFDVSDGVRLDRIIRWSAEVQEVTESDVSAERRRASDRYAHLDDARRRVRLEEEFGKYRPVADHFPVFGSIVIGRDGRFWVREYHRPAAPGPYEWMVFDAGGQLECRITIPDHDELLEFGADYLLALRRDSLDVETVVRHTITFPEKH